MYPAEPKSRGFPLYFVALGGRRRSVGTVTLRDCSGSKRPFAGETVYSVGWLDGTTANDIGFSVLP